MTKLDCSKLLILAAAACGDHDVEPQPDAPAAVEVMADAAPADSPPTEQCSATADLCAGDTICIAGRCEAAFGRVYDIRSIAVTLPTVDPNGYYWDFGGGAPDITVSISTDGVVRAMTATVNDQFSALFAGPYAVVPIGGGTLMLAAYDEDVTGYEFAYACAADVITAALLRARRLSCVSDGNTLKFTIEPR